MGSGKQARLKITYRYLVPATEFPRNRGKNVYGWPEDGDDSLLFHTIEANVLGDK